MEIMHYDAEFRREEATPHSQLSRETLRAVRVGAGAIRPSPHAGQAGGHWGVQKIVPSVTGLGILET